MAKRLPKDIVCVFYLLFEKSERLLRDADFFADCQSIGIE